MEKTPFIGLTMLDPDESIYADNSAFISRDRREIDRGLHIGIKTHRHDGSAGLSNPLVAPSGLVIGSGGTIPAGISLTLGYSLEDAFGGETLISPSTLVTTPIPLDSPQTAPTAVLDTTAGTLDVDTFTYALTWSDGEGGETPLGPSTTISRDPGFANARIKLSGLNVGMAEAGAAEWRLYRARSGGTYVLLTTGTGATFNDDGSVAAQCDVNPPTFNVNTTGSINQLQFTIPTGSAIGQATWINLYASQAGDFAESCLLAQVPVGSAGASLIFPSLELLDAQPPDVNRSYGGASKIDPDTELLDNPWKRPVALLGDLPAEATHGDVRCVLALDVLYLFNKDDEWVPLLSTGSGAPEEEEEEEFGKTFTDEFGVLGTNYMSLGRGKEFADAFELPTAGELVYTADSYETPYAPKNRKYTGKVLGYIDFLSDDFVGPVSKTLALQMSVNDRWEWRQSEVSKQSEEGGEYAESLSANLTWTEEEKLILAVGFNARKIPFEEDGGVQFGEVAFTPGHKLRLQLVRETNKLICKLIDLDESGAVLEEMEVTPTLPISEEWTEEPVYVGFVPGGEGSCPSITKFHVEGAGVIGVKRFEKEPFEFTDNFPSIIDANFSKPLAQNFELVEPGELLGLDGSEHPGMEVADYDFIGPHMNVTGDFDMSLDFSTPTSAIQGLIYLVPEKDADDLVNVELGSTNMEMRFGPQGEDETVDTDPATGWHSGHKIRLRLRIVGANVVATVVDLDEGEALLGTVEHTKPAGTLGKRYRLGFRLCEVSNVGVPTLYAAKIKGDFAEAVNL